ncbi:hypothetical protein ACXWR7_09770, partial [Streptococcus pyogenes]
MELLLLNVQIVLPFSPPLSLSLPSFPLLSLFSPPSSFLLFPLSFSPPSLSFLSPFLPLSPLPLPLLLFLPPFLSLPFLLLLPFPSFSFLSSLFFFFSFFSS